MMTCILYHPRDGYLGSDSLRTWQEERAPVNVKKIHQIKRNDRTFMVGLAGYPAELTTLFDAFIEGKLVKTDSVLIVVELLPKTKHRAWVVGADGGSTEITGHIAGAGCGACTAEGAAIAGASCKRAIAIAIERNVKCGGKIVTVPIGKVDRSRRRG